jgi:hypothetical protein
MKVLTLTLKKKYFIEILTGKKIEEYRQVKGYWVKRLTNQNDDGSVSGSTFYKKFAGIKFKNGYGKNAPEFFAEFNGIEIKEIQHEMFNYDKVGVFAIRIGAIVQVTNCSHLLAVKS